MNAVVDLLVTPARQEVKARPRTLLIGSNDFTDAMESHVLEALRELGCTAEFFAARGFGGVETPLRKAVQKFVKLALREPERLVEGRLLEALERLRPELILVIHGSQLSPKSVQLMRTRSNAPIVCWCQDSMTSLGRQYQLGAQYDAVFVKDRYMQAEFARMFRSTPFHYLPEACNPRVHRRMKLTGDEQERFGCDVMIAGTLYYYRQEILSALNEFNVKIYGGRPSWLIDRLPGRHTGRIVFGDDKVRVVRAARIALNTLHFSEVDGLNARAFELAGCGAFQLINARAVIAEHFRVGEEIETFDSVDDLVGKVRHYLRHPDLTLRIGDAAGRRAHAEHTFARRLETLLATVFAQRQSRSKDGAQP